MTTLDYEVNVAYNRQRVMDIRNSVRTTERAGSSVVNGRPLLWLRMVVGGALIAAGQHVCGSTIRCQLPRQTMVGRAS